MLREEVAKRSSYGPDSINLICAGKVLKDGDGNENLSQLGIKNNAKILASRICAQEGRSEFMAEEERFTRLARVKWVLHLLSLDLIIMGLSKIWLKLRLLMSNVLFLCWIWLWNSYLVNGSYVCLQFPLVKLYFYEQLLFLWKFCMSRHILYQSVYFFFPFWSSLFWSTWVSV